MKQDKEHLINKIFDDLEKNAMPFDNHVYDVKAANQIIRNHIQNVSDAELMLYNLGFDDVLLSDEQGKRMYVSELMEEFAKSKVGNSN